MTFQFVVDKVADTRYRAFVPDPSDPLNTTDSGKWIQEVSFVRIPHQTRGGIGSMVLQLNEADEIGKFKPGAVVQVEITVGS